MKKILSLIGSICLLGSAIGLQNTWAANVNGCAPSHRSMDQQISLSNLYISGLKANDPNAAILIPLVKDIFYGYTKDVRDFLDSGANPNTMLNIGVGRQISLLDVAIIACQPTVAKILVNEGAGVDGNDSFVPLVNAANNGMDLVVELLLSKGADPNAQDISGDVALQQAVSNNYYSTTKLLLEHGADPNHSIVGKGTILSIAMASGNSQIVALLRAHGAVDQNN